MRFVCGVEVRGVEADDGDTEDELEEAEGQGRYDERERIGRC